MNILVSDKWLREYIRTPKKPSALAAALYEVGPSVERIVPTGADLDNIVAGKITALEAHPNADKLRIAVTDVGSKKLRIVCGGINLRVGQFVAVALVGSRVRWHGEGDLVTLEPATIRGVASEGMICASDEIGLLDRFPKKEEREVVDITALGVRPGTPLADALGLNDAVYDIEVTTNRPDALGVVGLARETAAATGGTFLWREPKKLKAKSSKLEALKINIVAKKLCKRYQGALIEGITVSTSPDWLQNRLVAGGLRPINAVVDVMNYVMLELGEPLHAFDADTITDHVITVRTARSKEKINALDGATYTLSPEMLVIANGNHALAVAGVIGGEGSKVTERTKNIIIEAASFDAGSIRKTARALNLRTDAVMRFEKNMPAGLTTPALARAVELINSICGGTFTATADVVAQKERTQKVSIPLSTLTARIGVALSPATVKKLLSSIGFKTIITASTVSVTVPYWRVGDISIAEDIIEEVARLYGYGNLPAVLPTGALTGEAPDPVFGIETALRRALVAAGATDCISISLVGDALLKKSGEGETPVVCLTNPLTEELTALRPSHRARLVEAVANNEKMQVNGALFELGAVFIPSVSAGQLPEERNELAAVVWGNEVAGELFYKIKGLFERVAQSVHVPLTFGNGFPKNGFWHPGRSASLHIGTTFVGVIGELTPNARRTAGIESHVAFGNINLAALIAGVGATGGFTVPSEYPPVKRDIAFLCPRRTEHESIVAVLKTVDPLIVHIEQFDRYEGKGVPEGKKSLAYHLTYQSNERTLTASEIEVIHKKVSRLLETKFGATIRE